ncbi:hypothetical protein C4561_00155 [candidate division WWE3 bacterium]|jgi:hypothetical protein|uniref:Carboxypeptidase regulatory-like domain-containing protein n=1 Tax=candidate division WWE3 bacterium TaxID=2053526 RepID=A0A3A4ZNH2_UNCKA|nr:MAG: hypothetical protein C4561_00155 [candidate division WWE3 bacterium]
MINKKPGLKTLNIGIRFLMLGVLMAGFIFAQSFEVKGRVRDALGNDIPHAIVTAVCGEQVKTTEAAGNGFYSFNFSTDDCPEGSPLVVTAEDPETGETGQNSGTFGGATQVLDIVIGGAEVPEFGLVAGSIAALASAGAYLALKRKASKSL